MARASISSADLGGYDRHKSSLGLEHWRNTHIPGMEPETLDTDSSWPRDTDR